MTEEQTVENTQSAQAATPEVDEGTKTLAAILAEFPQSPTEIRIEQWKQNHGEVYCSGFSEEELVVWRPINRREFVQLQETVQGAGVSTLELDEEVVRKCLLWTSPKARTALEHKAGSLTTLNEQIMQNSNFINPQMASALVVKL
jgi:hypothetical protein